MATNHLVNTAPRNVGSDFTIFSWMGTPIARGTAVDDSGQLVLGGNAGPGYDIVHNLGENYPSDVVTGRAVNVGTLEVTLTELWNGPAWQQLGNAAGLSGIAHANDIVDIFIAQDALTTPITAQMLIKPLGSQTWRGWNYAGIKIVAVDQRESLRIDTITIARKITCIYIRRTGMSTPAVGGPTV